MYSHIVTVTAPSLAAAKAQAIAEIEAKDAAGYHVASLTAEQAGECRRITITFERK